MKKLIIACVALGFLGACDLTESRARFQRPGLLRLEAVDSIDFVAPDTVTLNTNFTISVTTYGGGCETKGPTDILRLNDGSAQFRPFDVAETGGDIICGEEIRTFSHSGTLQLNTAGPTT